MKHVGDCRGVTADGGTESNLWKIHSERLIDDTRRLRLSIASVELPDGVRFEQYVLRMPKAAMNLTEDDLAIPKDLPRPDRRHGGPCTPQRVPAAGEAPWAVVLGKQEPRSFSGPRF